MQEVVKEQNLSQKPRHLLVSGMSAKKILLSSPYLRWLLNNGLVVTKLYQVIEYTPQHCFKKFVQEVSDARRTGDVDKDKAIIADTMKLQGNSVYGSLIMDKEKHQNTHLKVNDPRFKKLTS